MRYRTRPEIRCPSCYLLRESCLCNDAPRISIRSALTVVHHSAELFKTTSTIRLLQLAVNDCMLHLRAGSTPHETPRPVTRRRPIRVALFPREDAVDLQSITNEHGADEIELLVPDGTWNQASRITRRDPHFKEVHFVKLQIEEPSVFVLREQADAGRISTFEAVAAALGILEGEAVQRRMMTFFREAVYRILLSKGLHRPSLRDTKAEALESDVPN